MTQPIGRVHSPNPRLGVARLQVLWLLKDSSDLTTREITTKLDAKYTTIATLIPKMIADGQILGDGSSPRRHSITDLGRDVSLPEICTTWGATKRHFASFVLSRTYCMQSAVRVGQRCGRGIARIEYLRKLPVCLTCSAQVGSDLAQRILAQHNEIAHMIVVKEAL